jgi:predicted P-loop ATPase
MISYWRGVTAIDKDIERTSVDDLLDRIKSGYWKEQVELVRSEQDNERKKVIKKTLPAVTIGGVFNKRNELSLETHSGFICIDIDGYTDRSKINADEYTYASFISCGGNGFAVICKIDPNKHKDSYNFISEYYFLNYGITVDPAPKNVASARFVSYDPEVFINLKSKKLKFKVEKKKKLNNISVVIPKTEIGDLVLQVDKSVIEDYSDYISLSFALAGSLGLEGKDYFHRLCSFSPKYDHAQAEKQYAIALKRQGTGITIGTFYYYLKQGGADLNKYHADKSISKVKLAKRINAPKQESIQQLIDEKNLSHAEAVAIVDEVYSRKDLDVRFDSGTENLITNLSNFIKQQYKIRKNLVTRKYELNGNPIEEKNFNSIYLNARLTFDDSAITFDLCNRIIMSEITTEYNPFLLYIESNKHRITTGNIDNMVMTIESKTGLKDRFIRKWLISIIACVYGNPVRSVLALTGGQNTGKTEWFRRLLPSSLMTYYAESNLDRGKDDELLMCENLIIMDDEMGGKSKQDEKRFKELTSKSSFSLRAAYGKHNEHFKRLALLCGTSNDNQLINDSTGNTRILPIDVISINHDLYNSIDKDDLFMELHRCYISGEEWKLEKTELEVLNDISQSFEVIPFERELLLKFFSTEGTKKETLSATEIKDYIECNTKQKIMSLKKLGLELKKLYGEKRFIDRQWKYTVCKIGLPETVSPW